MTVKVFVSYSHRDSRYVDSGEYSLLEYLKGLEREDVEFWSDRGLVTGENWDEKIKARIRDTDIALVLVSQAFLDSAYCVNTEIRGFLERCKAGGMVIFPVILSPCEWERYVWLKSRQFLPTNGETIEEHYTGAGNRKRLYHNIRQDLRKCIETIRDSRKPAVSARPNAPEVARSPVSPAPKTALEAIGYPSLIAILYDRSLSADRQTELYVKAYLLEEEIRQRDQGKEILSHGNIGSRRTMEAYGVMFGTVMASEDSERAALWKNEKERAMLQGGATERALEMIWVTGGLEEDRQRFPRLAQLADIRRKILDGHSERATRQLNDQTELMKRLWDRES